MSSSDAPRRTAPPQRVSLLLQIYAIGARTGELMRREFARDSVRLDDYAALSAIGAWGPITLTDLAVTLGTPLTTMSDVVRRLETRRVVRRKPNPEDGRSTLVELTAKGDREWRAAWPALQRTNAAIRSALDVPEDEIRDSLRRLDAALSEALTDT